MRVGILSDIHGNLEALEVCLQALERVGAEKYIQCGDIIGYGPDAQACTQRVMQLPLLASVMGNHDALLAFPDLENLFNGEAKAALIESLPKLSAPCAAYLRTLPACVQEENFAVVHGTPFDPIKEYFHSMEQFNTYYRLWKGQVLFVGHTHLQFYIKSSASTCHMYLNQKDDHLIMLDKNCRYVINPGAVGKPRDHNPYAACGLWDTNEHTFAFMREPYDFTLTQEKMRQKHYPDFLIESLAYGM
ncbi:MAG: metallophosphoesterase family protein [Elusimicrobiaceae bacterium]|nr:metallophosphoesterase family protein [Elusimicrobiaceae bacterium]